MQFAKIYNSELSKEDYSKLLSEKANNVSKVIKAKIGQQHIGRYANLLEKQIPIVDILKNILRFCQALCFFFLFHHVLKPIAEVYLNKSY